MREKNKEQAACAAHPFSDESDGLQIICECAHVFQVSSDHNHPKLLRIGRKNTALRFRIAVVLDPLNKLQASVLAVLLADISKCIVHDCSFMIDSLVIKGHVRFASRQKYKSPCAWHRLLYDIIRQCSQWRCLYQSKCSTDPWHA